MLKFDSKKKIVFDYLNIFYFAIIKFVLLKTEKTLIQKYFE